MFSNRFKQNCYKREAACKTAFCRLTEKFSRKNEIIDLANLVTNVMRLKLGQLEALTKSLPVNGQTTG
jgi:hypothetical protein